MNTSAKYQANWTETVGEVVRTRFCRQTDHQTDRQADSSIPPPPKLRLRGYNQGFTTAQVDNNGKHGLFLHEQLAHLHTGNTQTKLQT